MTDRSKTPAAYEIIDRSSIDLEWNGSPLTLMPNQNANMPQTMNGTMVFAYQNVSSQNNAGQLSATSGGGEPQFLNAPALVNQPSMWIDNWKGNNLSLTNVSINQNTPISIQAIGPGMPGATPAPLPIGSPVSLSFGKTAQGDAAPQWMQLVLQCNAPTLCIAAVIGGPADASGNNGYVISVNDGVNGNTGPNTGAAPPAGYYATTTTNAYTLQFNWGSSAVFVANMSSLNAGPLNVTLRQL